MFYNLDLVVGAGVTLFKMLLSAGGRNGDGRGGGGAEALARNGQTVGA